MFDKICEMAIETTKSADLNDSFKKLDVDAELNEEGFTPAAWLAYTGKHESVEVLRLSGADVNQIAGAYARANKQMHVLVYQIRHKANINYIAQGYAIAGNHAKVGECIKVHKADVKFIILGYIKAKMHEQVEKFSKEFEIAADQILYLYAQVKDHIKVAEYKNKHNIPDCFVAYSYAVAGEHEKVNELETPENASHIAKGYAYRGEHEKVEKFREKYGVDVNIIAQVYAYVGNNQKAAEYFTQYGANINSITEGYAFSGDPINVRECITQYKADPLIILQSYKEYRKKFPEDGHEENHREVLMLLYRHHPISKNSTDDAAAISAIKTRMIEVANRLEKGRTNHWNPYWMNSGFKLSKISEAVNELNQNNQSIIDAIDDKESNLYKALNIQRITPLTFFGKIAFNQAKSLTSMQNASRYSDKEKEEVIEGAGAFM